MAGLLTRPKSYSTEVSRRCVWLATVPFNQIVEKLNCSRNIFGIWTAFCYTSNDLKQSIGVIAFALVMPDKLPISQTNNLFKVVYTGLYATVRGYYEDLLFHGQISFSKFYYALMKFREIGA